MKRALARIVSAPDADIRPMVWRSGPARPRKSETHQPAAATIGPDLEAQIQQQVRLAFESGLRDGEAAARQKLEGQARETTQQLARAIADVVSSREEALRNAEADIVRLSMEIARRIIHRELSVDPSALGGLIRAALEKVAAQQVQRVRIHPEQEAVMRVCLDEIGRGADIDVVADPAQPRGGAIFESSRGSLDASVDTQLREIERGLTDQLQKRS
ncbi:MAG TPA: FliH/SctL family protein [Bryobacteraceae bacterium]|jgi:flagellar assembly protein FliH|nr:FliH/SctL family protein [Bryobacteraceae bacterium]